MGLLTLFELFLYTQYKSYNNKITYNTTYELLYDTTKTVPGGAIDHGYPLEFNIDLKKHLDIKYKVQMEMQYNTKYKEKEKNFFTNKYFSRFHTA